MKKIGLEGNFSVNDKSFTSAKDCSFASNVCHGTSPEATRISPRFAQIPEETGEKIEIIKPETVNGRRSNTFEPLTCG